MALNFPDNPTPGQQYTDPNNLVWEFNGVVWMWGQNSFFGTPRGNLGDNTGVDKSSPVSVVGGFTDWCQVAATYGGSAGVTSSIL